MLVCALDKVRIRSVANGHAMTLALSASGSVYEWGGEPTITKCGVNHIPALVKELSGIPVGAIAAGGETWCAITQTGDLYT
jgi:hypothetical protein